MQLFGVSSRTFSTTALSLVVPAMGFRGSAEISWMGSVMRPLWAWHGCALGCHCGSLEQQDLPRTSWARGSQRRHPGAFHSSACLPQGKWKQVPCHQVLHLLPKGRHTPGPTHCFWRSLCHRLWEEFSFRLSCFPISAGASRQTMPFSPFSSYQNPKPSKERPALEKGFAYIQSDGPKSNMNNQWTDWFR